MKPLPKIVGIAAALGAVASAVAALIADPAVAGFFSQQTLTVAAAVCAVIANLAHSLTGTGGK